MSNMASCIVYFSMLCMKNADMLLYMTNTYRHCIQMVLIAVPICNIYNGVWTLLIHQVPVYKEHSYAMPIFVIKNFPIQLAIFDVFPSHFA